MRVSRQLGVMQDVARATPRGPSDVSSWDCARDHQAFVIAARRAALSLRYLQEEEALESLSKIDRWLTWWIDAWMVVEIVAKDV